MKIATKFLFLIILAFSCMPVFAEGNYCETSMCPAETTVSGPIASTLSKISGMNFLVSKTLESQIKKQMDKALNTDFKVELEPFGAKSMLEGKFKSFSAHSDTAYFEGFYISNVNAQSLCGYNHFVYKDGQVYTNENFLMSFSIDVTSADLQKMVNTPEYLKMMNSLNVSVAGLSVFKIFDPKAEIKDNRLVFSMKVVSPLTLGEPKMISTSMGLDLQDGKLIFTDVQTSPNLANANLNVLLPLINKLNPFVFKANIMNNSKSIIKLKDINFVDNKIVIKGLVIVPKNYYNN